MAHLSCNRKRWERQKIPVYCHNLEGFDSNFILRAIGKKVDEMGAGFAQQLRLDAISTNTEKMRSIGYRRLMFLDSLAFLDASLDKVVKDLKDSSHKFPILRRSGLVHNREELNLLSQKGIFPYSWVQSVKQCRETTSLPDKECFFNELSGQHVTDEEYERAQEVFRSFNCRNMLDYMMLYNKSDVLLLAEGISAFREEVFTHFGLDMTHYISIPQIAWDAYLKHCNAEVELISNKQIIADVEASIRGGNSFCRERYLESTDKEQIIYIDA